MSGTGVKYNDGAMNDASHLFGKPLLKSKDAIDHFSINYNNLTKFSKTKIDRPRKNHSLFEAPYYLLTHGIDMSDYTLRVVYAERNFVFTESILAIKGSLEQKALLFNLADLFNSSFYAYLNLMIGSRVGIEREEQKAKESLHLPFVQNDTIALLSEEIQRKKSYR